MNAPGARIVAAVNHYSSSYTSGSSKTDRVNDNTTYPYGAMQGTSMAAPCVSGIIAQWLQACVEVGTTPTPAFIKEVIENTWDRDEWTEGTNPAGHGAKTFGTHGKINALKGLEYILGCSPISYSLNDVVTNSNVVVGKTYRITDNDLTAIYISEDGRTLYCKDNNKYASPGKPTNDQTDYLHVRTDIQKDDWDQSNWVALLLGDNVSEMFSSSLIGYPLTGVKGVVNDKLNPSITLSTLPVANNNAVRSTYPQNLNTFLPSNFDTDFLATENLYFFVAAKPVEVANVLWAQWDEDSERFVVPSKINYYDSKAGGSKIVDGEFYANFSRYEGEMPELVDGDVYKFVGLSMRENASTTVTKGLKSETAKGYTVYPLRDMISLGNVDDNGTVTSVKDLRRDISVTHVDYYNSYGIKSSVPFKGINVVISTMSDGSRVATKMIK